MSISAAIDRLLSEAVAAGIVPGLAGGVANAAGVRYLGAAGVRAAGGAEAMTPDTLFWLASMTKLVTTIAAMRLVERGEIDLDAPVTRLLPELAEPRVLTGLDPAGQPITRPAQGAITLRHLLTHTAGIGYEFMHPTLLAARGPAGPPPATSLASLQGPLAHDPGVGWTYGFGVDWAGLLIERQSGDPLGRHLLDYILAPLGMHDTGFVVPEAAIARQAATHLRGPDAAPTIIPSLAGEPQDWEFYPGGAGLYGTAPDYLRLLRMILRGGELDGVRILAAATIDAMWENQVGDLAAGRLDTAAPALTLPYDPLPGQKGGWSLLGVRNAAPVPDARLAGSASWAGIAGTFYWIDREADLCGVLLAQLMPFADPALGQVQTDFERTVYAEQKAFA